ncbi:MAG: Tim44 domain-containing protein [Desulforhabdus sp.]|nr:Tim44 domain-containing protein [Desulforhabdus sp.]
MKPKKDRQVPLVFLMILVFAISLVIEAQAWARVGGGKSFGSRGSRSYSTPSSPSNPSSSSRYGTSSGSSSQTANQPYSGGWSRSPFTQGLMGGLAGGLLGSMLFGGSGHAAAGGGVGGGGIGLMDIALIGLLIYFAMKFFRRRQQQSSASTGYYNAGDSNSGGGSQYARIEPSSGGAQQPIPWSGEKDAGLAQVRQFDSSFSEEAFKDTAQDMFFRIQAAWMNRSLDGIEKILTPEMAEMFRKEFGAMAQQGRINRLENIAVRKVELSEIWQETGKDFVTVLFTANLLDYTVDDKTGEVVEGDRLSPVKFQEYWTFSRDIGSGSNWQLSAIQQTT